MWFLIAALVGVALGVFIMYKPAPTPLDDAISHIQSNRHAAALPILEDLQKKNPDETMVFPWLAQCYLRTDRLAEGRTALDTALRYKLPETATAPVVLSYADFYANKDDYAEAERLYESARSSISEKALAPGRAQLYTRWSDYDANNGHIDQAVKHLELAHQLMPQNDPAKAILPHKIGDYYRQLAGEAESKNEDLKKVVSLLQTSLKWSDEPATRMALGSIFMRSDKPAEAIEHYKVVCAQDANNLEARHHLIQLYLKSNNLEEAQRALFELTEKERSIENFELLASLGLKIGNYAGAVRALEDAIVLRPKDVLLLTKLHTALVSWNEQLARDGKQEEAMSVKGHAERVSDLLKEIAKADEKAKPVTDKGGFEAGAPGSPPVSLVASRIWLAKGSYTPEGEIRFKNISGQPVSELALDVVFWDNTSRKRNGSVSVNAVSESHPMEPGAIQSVYFSCPNIVKSEHQLAVLILWRGRLLKELPVVKER